MESNYYWTRPYGDSMALKWGTKFEQLQTYSYIAEGRVCRTAVLGMMGLKIKDKARVVTGYGIVHGYTIPLYRNVRYRHCRRILFWNKCSYRYKRLRRGFYPSELSFIRSFMLAKAFIKAGQSIKSSPNPMAVAQELDTGVDVNSSFTLDASNLMASGNGFLNKVFGVDTVNLPATAGALIKNTMTPSLVKQIQVVGIKKRNHTLYHTSSQGKFKLMFYSVSGRWTIEVSLF